MIKKIKIDDFEILLENISDGVGKIIITNPYLGAWSYTWGTMGSTIEEFLIRINDSYFTNKLTRNIYKFSGKQTAKNVRKYIREEMNYELPFYKYMGGQKELRGLIKELEKTETQYEALYLMENMSEKIYGFDMSYEETKEFEEIISSIFDTEPWHFLGEELTTEYKELSKLHKKLKNFLTKELVI